MNFGKTIELYLVDGTNNGIVTAELSNWNGKAIKIHRTDINNCNREDITLPGVYFLFCENNSVYIGEAENVKDRLIQHINDNKSGKEKYYWATAVCFVSDHLDKALIRYLENKLVDMARINGTYQVLTKNTYKKTVLKESQIASMDEFISNIQILIKTLGYSIIDAKEVNADDIYFYCKGSNADAKGYQSSNGFTVVKGSKVSDHIVDSFKTNVVSYYKLREEFESNGMICDSIMQKDYEFSSPSQASSIILGRPSNGNDDWKTKDGTKLKDIDN